MSVIPQLHRMAAHASQAGANVIDAREKNNSLTPETTGVGRRFYIRFGKRLFDAVGAAAGVVVMSPILLLCAVAVQLESRGPIFFRQWRVGRNGKPFRVMKFRTMVDGAYTQGPKITASGDPRITRVGKFLRKTKLDELPQFFNVLRNEMTLVGPRPEVPEYTAKYTLLERKVLDVSPGITGAASLSHINEEELLATRTDKEHFYVSTIMRRKLEIDLAYCQKMSFSEDLKIILMTAAALFVPRGMARRHGDASAV